MQRFTVTFIQYAVILLLCATPAGAAYHHGQDTDSDRFVGVYPHIAGTKLDSCAVCHTGGQYEKKTGQWVSLGSCQWCHHAYGYDQTGDINATLNSYGRDYQAYGGDDAAIATIASLDSDGDGFTNGDEITALHYPGSAADDPSKIAAPYRIITRDELEQFVPHNQFLLMNTHKSGDFYADYGGVKVADVLDLVGVLPSATGIQVFAPDGWSQYHPLQADGQTPFYPVYGTYPQATFFNDPTADQGINPSIGWCDYSAPGCAGRIHGEPIGVPDGLHLLLAYTRDGAYLQPGELSADNRLDGEGPFRIVVPQKQPGPPDQSVKSPHQDVVWPFDNTADHNAGYATRSVTMIRVDPLPAGTTDIDTLEAGWDYVDEGKIIVYGAIDPLPAIDIKLTSLLAELRTIDRSSFRRPWYKWRCLFKTRIIEKMIDRACYWAAARQLQHFLRKVDSDGSHRAGWITDPAVRQAVYWKLHEIDQLLAILLPNYTTAQQSRKN